MALSFKTVSRASGDPLLPTCPFIDTTAKNGLSPTLFCRLLSILLEIFFFPLKALSDNYCSNVPLTCTLHESRSLERPSERSGKLAVLINVYMQNLKSDSLSELQKMALLRRPGVISRFPDTPYFGGSGRWEEVMSPGSQIALHPSIFVH